MPFDAFRALRGAQDAVHPCHANCTPATPLRAGLAGGDGADPRCRFQPVPAGTCAVAVVHDENGNQTLDSNNLGVPTEGYGVSSNRTYALSDPRWDESRFELAAGEHRQLTIRLRY